MARILALDYGTTRIGMALSDPLGMTAQPHGYIDCKSKNPFKEIIKIIYDFEVSRIVIGLPTSMKGTTNAMAKEVEAFVEKLKPQISINVEFWDERLSTSQAEKFLITANVRREKRKEVRDAVAASLILQSYLASKPNPFDEGS